MVTAHALIQKTKNRWQHYVMLCRWKRANRIKGLLARLEGRRVESEERRRKSA